MLGGAQCQVFALQGLMCLALAIKAATHALLEVL
jgi:hypothetical protein